jgi:hypothetical protein
MRLAQYDEVRALCVEAVRAEGLLRAELLARRAARGGEQGGREPSRALPVRAVSEALARAFPDSVLARLGATWDVVLSVFAQVLQEQARQSSAALRGAAGAHVAAFQAGAELVDLALAGQHSPYLLARSVTERVVLGPSGGAGAQSVAARKREVTRLMRRPEAIADERLRAQVRECVARDPCFSPLFDRARDVAGDEFEYMLERELAARGIAFQSEHQLRDQGMAKTPDVKLDVPIGVLGPRGEPRVLFWVDSKAMFGDPHAHALNRAQLEGYVNRYGPGAVLYWHGFVEELNSDPTILLLERVPALFATSTH